MIAYGKRSLGEKTRRALALGANAPYYKSEWMSCGQDPWLSPTIFMVEQPPGSQLPTHFHRQNEFQVVVRGSGSIGTHAITPISVHYAGAYTGYGPVTAGEDGLTYFTIRPVFDTGAVLAAEARTQMIRGPKRQIHAAPYPVQPLSSGDVRHDTLIEPAADGLFCGVSYLPANGQLQTEAHPESGGTFYMVLDGELTVAGESLGQWETAYLSAGEPALTLQAAAAGATVMVMRVPATDAAYLPNQSGA
jgi:hypothetical protein